MWSNTRVRRLRADSHSDTAYRLVRDLIASGGLSLGKPLSRRALSREIGIGILPVTEAVKRLEYDGLLESKPRVGTRVKIPTMAEIRDLCTVREAFEVQSARLFALEAEQAHKQKLSEIAGRLDELISDRNSPVRDFFAMHLLFHQHVARHTGCAALLAAIDKTSILQQTWLSIAGLDLRWMMLADHRDVASILSLGDPERAGRAMRDHVQHRREELMDYIEVRFREGDNASTPMRRAASRTRRKTPEPSSDAGGS